MRHGAGRLEAAQRAAGVPAALELIDDAGRALLLLAYRHRMPDSEIAARVGADQDLVAGLREKQLERLVTVTGASSRDAVIAWLEFVPEAGAAAALPGTALVPVERAEPRGDVWREATLMLALLAALLVLYAAAEVDPSSRPATVPAHRPPAATRVAVAPDHGARQPEIGSDRASRYAGRKTHARPSAVAAAPPAVRAPSSASVPVQVAAAPPPSAGAPEDAPRGTRGIGGVTTTAPAPAPPPASQPQAPAPPTPSPPVPVEDGDQVVARGGPEPAAPHPSPAHPGGPPGLRGGGPPGLRGGGPPGLRGGGPPGLRGGGPPGHRR
jgi:hypothetical protein